MDAPQRGGASLEETMHYKRMFDDKEFLYAFDLDGREVTVTIEKCVAGKITGEKGRESKKPLLHFVGKQKKLAINKTNGKTIASLYGNDVENWAGKSIVLYPTTTTFGSETVECIRVKNVIPQPPQQQRDRNARKLTKAEQDAAKQAIEAAAAAEADEPEHDAETGEVIEANA
jgi:hypothetical protein